MTTDGITLTGDGEEYGAEELVIELGRLGAAAKSRADQVRRDMESTTKKRANARIGARVVERKLLDDEQVLAEEAEQLGWILSSSSPSVPDPDPEPAADDPEPVAPAADPPPAAPEPAPGVSVFDQDAPDADDGFKPEPPYTWEQLNGMSNQRLHVVAKHFGMDQPVTDDNRTVIIRFIMAVQKMESDRTRPQPALAKEAHVLDVRYWQGWQWVLALVFGFVGLLVGLNNYESWTEVDGDWSWLVTLVIVASCTAIGFFAGGLLGLAVELRQKGPKDESG